MSDYTAIRRCIAGCVKPKDGRGLYQNQQALYERLLTNTTPTIARATAQAARAVGEGIAMSAKLASLGLTDADARRVGEAIAEMAAKSPTQEKRHA